VIARIPVGYRYETRTSTKSRTTRSGPSTFVDVYRNERPPSGLIVRSGVTARLTSVTDVTGPVTKKTPKRP